MNFGPPISTYSDKVVGYYGLKALPFHTGHLNCIFKAAAQVDVLFVSIGYDDQWDKKLCEGTKFPWVPANVRERWVTAAVQGFDNVRVISNYERRFDDYMSDKYADSIHTDTRALLSKMGGRVDKVFSSENEYEPYFRKYFPGAEHVLIDANRYELPISATEIRNKGVYQMWEYLPRAVQNHFVKRVALVGVESVGKSTISKMLAEHYNTVLVPEYGRLFYEDIGGFENIDTSQDYVDIAAGHVHNLNMAQKHANKIMIVDTDITYTRYFHTLSFGNSRNHALEAMEKAQADKIDLYLFLMPYNQHVLDGTRLPVEIAERKKRNKQLRMMYTEHGRNIVDIDEPTRLNRLTACIEHIDEILK